MSEGMVRGIGRRSMVKRRAVLWLPVLLSLAALACSVFSPGATATPLPPTIAPATDTAAPPPTESPAAEPPTDAPPTEAPPSAPADATATESAPAATDTVAAPAQQFIAYLDANRQLLVTDVSGGV